MIHHVGNVYKSELELSKKKYLATEDFSEIFTDSIKKREKQEVKLDEFTKKYDVRNMTFVAFKEMAQQLYAASAITLKEVAIMTFDYDHENMNEIAGGVTSLNFTTNETTAASKRKDWIVEFEKRAAKDLKYGNLVAHANKTKIVSILKSIAR